MMCPRCHKHRLRSRPGTDIHYCKGCGWEKGKMTAVQEQTMAKFEIRQKEMAEAHKNTRFIDMPANPPAISEWIRNVENEMVKAVGIPAELMRPKEPEHKQSLMAKFFGKFKSV